jgi:glycosyltransferase involved in cell wall biosynthesis
MKIIITSTVMPIRGGVGSHIDTIAQELCGLGNEVRVINTFGGDRKGFKTFSYKLVKLINPILKNDLFFILSFLSARWIVYLKMIKEIGNEKNLTIHAHDINAFNGLYKLCKRKKIKLVLTIHGFLHEGCIATREIKKKSLLYNYLYREEVKAFKNADSIITIASYHYNVLKNITNESKLNLIPNFIDCNLFHPYSIKQKQEIRKNLGYSMDEFFLIYAGRLEKSKGLIYVLEALVKLRNHIKIRFIIAGNGGEKDNLKNFAKSNNLESQVSFIGEVPRERLIEFYNISNVFVMTSIKDEGNLEGTSIALIEAMACGLPVITTDIGGLKDIVEVLGDSLLVKEKDSDSIVEKLEALLSSKELQIDMSRRSFEAVAENYSLDSSIKRIYNIYRTQ